MDAFNPVRCAWCLRSPEEILYHDTEWGVPLHDERKLFEFLLLDTFQPGLSWTTIIRKRQNFRDAFCQFDPEMVAAMKESDVLLLMQNPGIIRNRSKIQGAITNARAFLNVQKMPGGFNHFIWQFTNEKTLQNQIKPGQTIPTVSFESECMSREMRKLGFAFAGPVVCYAFMQAIGMVNDHSTDCFRHAQLLS
ncbi:MAG: DNA-3-methyladenine glycosylase I [Candidatus Competibacteraceae bacterium]|nr:DNA-3-methyladenine glycosylase I [Candidatus Competibacteraceae bacterium]